MQKQAVLNKEQDGFAEEVLKLTALVYFQEALDKQQYESCAELTAAARKFGVQQYEIDAAITSHLRGKGSSRF